jgi:hypothetical protein
VEGHTLRVGERREAEDREAFSLILSKVAKQTKSDLKWYPGVATLVKAHTLHVAERREAEEREVSSLILSKVG